jgi:hypothetical protein
MEDNATAKKRRRKPFVIMTTAESSMFVLFLLLFVPATAGGVSLTGSDHRCEASEEGKIVSVRMTESIVVDCRCKGGIVHECMRPPKIQGRRIAFSKI